MNAIPRPCVTCGRPTFDRRGRCPQHMARLAYSDPAYRLARAEVLARSGGRCTAVENGRRCRNPAVEVHHVEPLASAPSAAAAFELNRVENLVAVCRAHNPRGSSL